MENNQLRVLITTNIPAPYMIGYLSELGKKTDLTVLFEVRRAKDRDASWYGEENKYFKSVFLNGIPCGTEAGLSFKIIKFLSKKKYDRIIIANPTTPTGIIALLYCRWFKIPFIIQSEGGFQGSGKGLKEKFKKYIMEKAQFYLTGMGGENDYFLKYGATKEKLCPYPFSSLNEADIENARVNLAKNKSEVRDQLGIHENHVILSVGRFSYDRGYGKGYDILMRMAEEKDKSFGIYIVGDDPTEEFLRWKNEKKLENVHFIPFKGKEELANYYLAADLFAILSRGDTWGLVVNEAMAYALPIVSSNRCIAGIELIENGKNGFVVSLDNESYIFDTITNLACDIESCRRYGELSFSKIRTYTIENMANVIYNYINR